MAVEFRVLGPLEVTTEEGTVTFGSHKQRSVLALLLMNHGSVVSSDRLIDELWGEDATDRQNALWVHISNLRSAIEPDRQARTGGSYLLTRSPGYVLDVTSEQIDAVSFERLVDEGRNLVEDHPAEAGSRLAEALSLWRGRPYEEFTYEPFAQDEINRLDELRIEAVEARIEADVATGRAREVISELTTLVRQHPLRERLTELQMLALYRSGRQAEALRSYQDLRSRLNRELGIEPGPGVKGLEQRILEEDPTLTTTSMAQSSLEQTGLAVRGYEIRELLSSRQWGRIHRAFQPEIGREVAITIISPDLADYSGFIRRFEDDARLVAGLEHPHIVPLYDYWREPGAAYLVNRLTGDETLARVIATSALSETGTATVARQIAGALDFAHSRGVVHGNLTAESIELDDDGNAYLAGFGLGITMPGGELGNAFTPPESGTDLGLNPASDIYALAVVLAQAMTGLNGTIDQIKGALPQPVAEVISMATDPDPTRRPGAAAFGDALIQALDEDQEPQPLLAETDLQNPYRGLAAFGAADADVFFGRQRVIDRLVSRLGTPADQTRMIAVVGPSGSGKSSVVRAGLRPALTGDAIPGSSDWYVTEMTPGEHPFESLETALLRVAVDPPDTLFEQLTGAANGLRRAAKRILPDDGSPLLIIIDQFEELFTLASVEIAERFLDTLTEALADTHGRVNLVVTLRADFYDRPLQHREFGELLRDGTEVITPLSDDELESAITGPVANTGVRFEPVVIAEIVREVEGRPGGLPLLQYALTELFEQRSGPSIGMSTYQSVGGVTAALARRADSLLDELNEHEEEAARQILLRLVTLGEGALDTRRRVLVSELQDLPLNRRALDIVLDRFSSHRLLTYDRDPVTRGPTVEISHEALLTEWGRLRDWIEAARDDVRNQRRLAEAMAEWVASGRRDDLLLTAGRLNRFAAWAVNTEIPLGSAEQEFLEHSIDKAEKASREKKERERQRVEAEKRARDRLRQIFVVGAAAVLVGVLAVVAFLQSQEAQQSEEEIAANLRAHDLAASANLRLADDIGVANRVALEAAASTAEFGYVTGEAMDALHWVVQEAGLTYPADGSTPVAVRPGPRGPTGVFALSPPELIALAHTAPVSDLGTSECAELFGSEGCPDPMRPLPDGLVIAGGNDSYGVVAQGPGALAGTKIDLVSAYTERDTEFENELIAFEEKSGIGISHGASGTVVEWGARLRDADPLPDVAIWPRPSDVAELAGDYLIDLSGYLDVDEVRSDFSAALVELGTVAADGSWPSKQGGLYGLPVDVDLKGLVFYPKARFEDAGYQVPRTWDQLVTLSEQMVADGHTPWCHHFASGLASGWPGTDLMETLVLRVGGTEIYDAWVDRDIPFDSPEIQAAGEMAETLLLTERFARGGSGAISRFDVIGQGLAPMLGDSPECWLTHGADFMLTLLPAQTQIGVDVDFFPFPGLENDGDALETYGGGGFMVATRDRPEVRVFLEYAASPEWGRRWAAYPSSFISPNARFNTDAYGSLMDEPEAAELRRDLGELTASSIEAGVWRFDASDLMPSFIGGVTDDGTRGVYLQGMVDVADGVRTIDEVLTDIEAVWSNAETG